MALYFGQVVIGTAGSGKSTYCEAIQNMAQILHRKVHIVNLDPACEKFFYSPLIDINDLISSQDVMEELELGPNGSLLYCMEYLLEQLNDLGQDDYVLFDCPGQIEIFQSPIMSQLLKNLCNLGFSLCTIYLLDITFIQEADKFVSGILMALSAMIALGLPHLTVLSKCDLVGDRKLVKRFLKRQEEEADYEVVVGGEAEGAAMSRYQKMTRALKQLVNQYGIVSIVQMDINDVDSVKNVIYQADLCLQYGENLEVNDREYSKQEDREDNFNDQQ